MSRILIVMSAADTWERTDGTSYPTGYWAEELAAPAEPGFRPVVGAAPGPPAHARLETPPPPRRRRPHRGIRSPHPTGRPPTRLCSSTRRNPTHRPTEPSTCSPAGQPQRRSTRTYAQRTGGGTRDGAVRSDDRHAREQAGQRTKEVKSCSQAARRRRRVGLALSSAVCCRRLLRTWKSSSNPSGRASSHIGPELSTPGKTPLSRQATHPAEARRALDTLAVTSRLRKRSSPANTLS